MQQNKDGVQKLFKQFGHFNVILFLTATLLNAGSFEDFKRSQADSFSKYVDERDSAFKTHLLSQWKEYNEYKGTPLYETPKPKNIVSAKRKKLKSVGPKIRVKIEKNSKNSEQVLSRPIIKNIKQKDISFNFYGTEVGFNIDAKMKSAKFYPLSQTGIGNFFDVLASSDYSYLISSLQKSAKNMQLNDWGVYLLVHKLSENIYRNRDNAQLFSWFIFNKLGYRVKVGLSNKHIVVMYYSKKLIYATPNYKFKNKKYYVISKYAQGGVGSLYSYEQNYPDATKAFNLALNHIPNFAKDMRDRTLIFTHDSKEYKVEYKYNQNIIDFMATYPQADYETYFNAPVENITYQSIATSLKKHLDGIQASSAINFVLAFVQKSFTYQVDDLQFGREKVMFAQETLYYDKSDCEDRAILFAYLIKKIFKVGVIGVRYKDHMATALYIPISGDSVRSNGRRFVIADPTYINSSIGQSMPKYRSVRPSSFIIVKN